MLLFLGWATIISHLNVSLFPSNISFLFQPRGFKCSSQFQCKTVQFGELRSYVPFRERVLDVLMLYSMLGMFLWDPLGIDPPFKNTVEFLQFAAESVNYS